MVHVRRQHPVFGQGSFEILNAENPSVLAYLRRLPGGDSGGGSGGGSGGAGGARGGNEGVSGATAGRGGEDLVLCVNNLSRFAQPVELRRAHEHGRTPIELVGRVPFPPIGELPYFITLPPYGFYWFSLVDTER
ncbi:hypothetical protein BH18ACT4_BH18ACT4_04730 [soil metagenome]